jgi:hypothetical protein
MATKFINIGSSVGVFGYDDATFVNAIETTGPIKVDAAPTDSAHVLRLSDLGGLTVSAVEVVNIDDPSAELNGLSSSGGTILMAYQVGAAGDAFTYYAWDTAVADGEDVPFIVDGTGGFWIAVAGKYSALDVKFKTLSASRLVASDATKGLVSVSDLTSWIAGTLNQISSSDDGDGTITLSTPQDIHTGASPEFITVKISAATALRLFAADADKKLVSITDLTAWIAGTTDEITVSNDGDGTLTVSLPNQIKLDGATALRLLATDGSKITTSVATLTAWIAGTALEVEIADDGDGTITIGLPDSVTIKNLTPSEKLNLPMGEISYFSTTGTAIAIATVSDGSTNMVKVDPITSLNNEMEFDNGGADNGRLRYTGVNTKTFHVASTISFAPDTANDTFVVGIAKNGTVVAGSKILNQVTTASGIRSTAMHSMISLATNDYIEVYVGNITDADDFVIHTLTMFAMGM